MNALTLKATRIGWMSGDARTQHEETPEADKRWFADYVADRRRRGVPAQGVPMPGEIPDRLLPGPGLGYCRNNHLLTEDTIHRRMMNGYWTRECLTCRRIREERAASAPKKTTKSRPSKTHCPQGHEYTQENTYRSGHGFECRQCRLDKQKAKRDAARGNRPPRPLKTHCVHNHEYTPENTYTSPAGVRMCRACRRDMAKRRAAKKAAS